MGTPHQGSALADWLTPVAYFLGYVKQNNPDLVKALEKESPHLDELQRRFYNLLKIRSEGHSPLNVICCFEELSVPLFGHVSKCQVLSGALLTVVEIVPPRSAVMNGWPDFSIHANHMDMTKFGGDDSPGYVRVLSALQKWTDSAKALKGKIGETVPDQDYNHQAIYTLIYIPARECGQGKY